MNFKINGTLALRKIERKDSFLFLLIDVLSKYVRYVPILDTKYKMVKKKTKSLVSRDLYRLKINKSMKNTRYQKTVCKNK